MNEAHCPDCGAIVGYDARHKRWVDERTGATHWFICPEREKWLHKDLKMQDCDNPQPLITIQNPIPQTLTTRVSEEYEELIPL